MRTLRLPGTVTAWSGEWPLTSALGLSTLRYSDGRLKRSPESNWTVKIRPWSESLSSSGQGSFILAELARLVGQHDRNAVADRIGEARRLGDELLLVPIVMKARLGHRADQKL